MHVSSFKIIDYQGNIVDYNVIGFMMVQLTTAFERQDRLNRYILGRILDVTDGREG